MRCRGGVWEDSGCMRVDIDGAIVTYGRVLLGWGYCKGEGMVVSYVGLVC